MNKTTRFHDRTILTFDRHKHAQGMVHIPNHVRVSGTNSEMIITASKNNSINNDDNTIIATINELHELYSTLHVAICVTVRRIRGEARTTCGNNDAQENR